MRFKAAGGANLQFIEARFPAIGRANHEADKSRRHRRGWTGSRRAAGGMQRGASSSNATRTNDMTKPQGTDFGCKGKPA